MFFYVLFSGNPKDEPGAVVCRVAQSFLRFGSYQIHASRGKEDLDIVHTLADYTIRHHFPHIENMSKSESLSFSTGEEENTVVDLTSNKYAGEFYLIHLEPVTFFSCIMIIIVFDMYPEKLGTKSNNNQS